MQNPGTTHNDFLRVVNMAKSCQVDLSTALDLGQIDAPAYTDMVIGCGGCAHGGSCDRLLATAPSLQAAPEYCVNRDTFGQLRTRQAG